MCHLASWHLSTWSMQQAFTLTSRCIFPSVHSIMLIFCIFITVICLYIAILFVLFCLANMFNQIVWAVWHLPMICSLIYRMSFFLCFKRYFIFMTLVKSAPLPRQHHPTVSQFTRLCFLRGQPDVHPRPGPMIWTVHARIGGVSAGGNRDECWTFSICRVAFFSQMNVQKYI